VARKREAASNAEWKLWGERDPFWGVSTLPGRHRSGENPWTPEEFYAFGAQDWADFREQWARFGLQRGTCVEIGCGAGRLTMHLAAEFDQVIGVDVAEGMLDVAREHVRAANVNFRASNGIDLPVETASADAVLSTHVFQHLDSLELGEANFAEIARVLRPGGSAFIHLPLYWLPGGFTHHLEPVLALSRRLAAARAALQRRRGKLLMRELGYSADWLFSELPRLGFSKIEIVVFATSAHNDPHPCVLLRR
jgi:SAM-dependent methyltransferase